MNKQEQQRRKELLRGVEQAEKQSAESELPAPKETLQALFDWLDGKLEVDGCDHSLRFTLEFAQANKLDASRLAAWAERYGGYCDCEVAANVPDSNPVFSDHR